MAGASAERGIDKTKLKAALDGDLGDVLNKATGDDLTNILNRLDAEHVTGSHLDEITSRLGNADYGIKAELIEHPDRFTTFDDILDEPGKYWDLIEEGALPVGSYIRNWGQGKWWKELREKAKFFEGDPGVANSGVARKRFISENGLNQGKTVDRVTIEVEGINEQIRIDYLGQSADGKFHLGDAKFSTKDKNWATEWQSASTEHQKIVFPNMKGKDIYIKASDPDKLNAIFETFGIPATAFKDGAYKIPANMVGSLKIFGSAENNASIVKNVISVF